jgi:RNA polymerase sigma factor (sigma-70 family)
MSRKFKTGKKSRTTYIYYSEDGCRTVLRPGENGVTEADIALLHEMDDDEFDNDRRESSTERFSPFEDWLVENETTEDAEPLEKTVFRNLTVQKLDRAIETLQPAQKKLLYQVYFLGMKVTEIAREENVDESSIRERLKWIYKKLKNFDF